MHSFMYLFIYLNAIQVRERVEIEEAAAQVKAAEASAIKAECEAGLAEALPALEDSIKARINYNL